MTKKTIQRAVDLLSSILTEEDKEMQELVQQLMRILLQAPNGSSSIQLYPMPKAGQMVSSAAAGKNYQFRNDIVTVVPTACLIEDVQKLSAALNKAANPDYDAAEVLKAEGAILVECLGDVIEQYTVVPPDLAIDPSGSSLVAMGIESGIIVDADGSDIVCRAGKPISSAMSGGCCQCSTACPHLQMCFGGVAEDIPRNGRIAPMQMDIALDTTDDAIVEYLDNAFSGKA